MKLRMECLRYVVIVLAAASSVSVFLPAAAAVAPVPQLQADQSLTDLYYWRQEGREILLGAEEGQTYCFYGLRIGDKKEEVLKKLYPAFRLMYELHHIGHQYLLSDVVYPDYYLAVVFDSDDQVMLITYQKNQRYTLD